MADSLRDDEKLRGAVEDALTVITKLRSLCTDLDQVSGMLQLALENEGQLRLIMHLISKKAGGKLPS